MIRASNQPALSRKRQYRGKLLTQWDFVRFCRLPMRVILDLTLVAAGSDRAHPEARSIHFFFPRAATSL
jgi:hypothetical protein